MNQNSKGKRLRKTNTADGFTLIEVLAGIIMATVFVLITSQAIAISAVYRIRAQRQSEALLAIQQDLEDIRFDSLKAFNANDCNPTVGQTLNGYAAALVDEVREPADPAFNAWPYETTEIVQLLNKDYELNRTLNFYDAAPYHVMTVSYSVTDPGAAINGNTLNSELADFYTEVIPDAAFSCQ